MIDLAPPAYSPKAPAPPAGKERALTLGTLASGAAILLLLGAMWFWSNVLLLIFAALLIAIALRAGGRGLNRLVGLNVKLGVFVVLLVVIGLVVGAGWLAGPAVSAQFRDLMAALPQSWQALNNWLPGDLGQTIVGQVEENGGENAAQIAQRLPDLISILTGVLNSVLGSLSSFFVVLIVALYVAVEAPLYRRGALRLVPLRQRSRAARIMDELGSKLGAWMAGQAVDMVVVAILAWIGLWLLGVPLAFLLALIAGLTNIVPIVGPFFSGAIAVLFSLSQGPETALYVAILFFVIQMFEGEVLMPLIQRYAVELPPALTIIAIVAFGAMFGFAGVLLGTPLLIVAMLLIQRIYVEDVLGDQFDDAD